MWFFRKFWNFCPVQKNRKALHIFSGNFKPFQEIWSYWIASLLWHTLCLLLYCVQLRTRLSISIHDVNRPAIVVMIILCGKLCYSYHTMFSHKIILRLWYPPLLIRNILPKVMFHLFVNRLFFFFFITTIQNRQSTIEVLFGQYEYVERELCVYHYYYYYALPGLITCNKASERQVFKTITAISYSLG